MRYCPHSTMTKANGDSQGEDTWMPRTNNMVALNSSRMCSNAKAWWCQQVVGSRLRE